MAPLKVLVVLGSTRSGNMATRVGKWVKAALEAKNHQVDVFDPIKLGLPLLVQPYHFYPDPSAAPKELQELNARVVAADAFIIVTAEYNGQMPPALTNTLHHFSPSVYSYKASGIVSYSPGGFGGVRASYSARGYLVELGCLPVSSSVAVSKVYEAIDVDGKPNNDQIVSSLAKMIEQLDWWATAAKNQRETAGIPAYTPPK